MRATASSLLLLLCLSACPAAAEHEAHDPALESGRGLPARTQATPAPSPSAGPAEQPAPPEPEPEPEPGIDLDEPRQALANVGKLAFDALREGEFAKFRKLTGLDEGPVRTACPSLDVPDAVELEAKFNHCHRAIAWDEVAEAQVFAPKPTGEPASGCEPGIEDYGRLQLYLHMSDKKIWQVDFFGAVGADGKAIGVDGSVACKEVDEAPPL